MRLKFLRHVLPALLATGAVLLAGSTPALASTPAHRGGGPGGMGPALRSQIDAFAKATVGTNGITGVIVGIHDPAKGDLLAAYGDADRAGTPIRTNMHYRIASVTKTLTATAILQLAEKRKLSLDDRLDKYVPNIPRGRQITLRDLLDMRSGLYDYATDPDVYAAYQKNPLMPGFTIDSALKVIRAHPGTAPGQKAEYNNSNYLLLGLVMEKVTGEPAPATIERLAKRSGLGSTTFPTTPDMPKPYVHGYLLPTDPGPNRDVTRSSMLYPYTAGAVVSTVPDMLRYAEQLGTGYGLSKASFRDRTDWVPLTSSGVRLQYGLGILQVGDWIGHDGSIFGYSDVVSYLPSAKASVVVMVNASNADAVTSTDLWGKIVKVLHPDSLPTW